MTRFLLILTFFFVLRVEAQDTLRLMSYNLLNFGYFTSECTPENNSTDNKIQWLKTVVDHFTPDILAVNEISSNPTYHLLVLNQVMNTSGRTSFSKVQPTNLAGSPVINMVFYDSRKMGLSRQDVIPASPRDINVYRFYHKSPYLNYGSDTTFFYIAVAHLKAGNTEADRNARALATQMLIDFIQQKGITQPFFLTGDLNLYSSTEPAWINLTVSTGSYKFLDPLNASGTWSNNPSFSWLHTQSTRTVAGCGAGGGLNDRFDFILISHSMNSPDSRVKYIPGSYITAGQDGQRFNQSLISPPNQSLPSAVIQALFQMSDHLPVMLDFTISTLPSPYMPDLFFSEYVEGTGNNKALEIFNPLPVDVNLSSYRIERYVNGSTTPDTVSLAGTIKAGKTYVVVVDKRDPGGTGFNVPVAPQLQAVADTFLCPDHNINPTMYFNGNDAMALRKKTGELVDLIGKIGENPGLGWTNDSLCPTGPFTSYCGAIPWTANHTMIRKYHVRSGIKSNPTHFNPANQWDTLPVNTFDSLGIHRSISAFTVPPQWNYTATMASHVFIIPASTIITADEVPIPPGSFIGVFYRNETDDELCAGYIQWFGNQNIAVVAFGDDFLTVPKDGFYEQDIVRWRILNPFTMQEYDAIATYSQSLPQNDGRFVSGGMSLLTQLTGRKIHRRIFYLTNAWQGISFPITPKWPSIEKIFGNNLNHLIYLSDGNLIHCPLLGFYQITLWDYLKGYLLKTNQPISLEVTGYQPENRTIALNPGWNIIPVLSDCPIPTSAFGVQLENKIILIKEIGGTRVYWPEVSIHNLEELYPGKAYMILVIESCSFTYETCN